MSTLAKSVTEFEHAFLQENQSFRDLLSLKLLVESLY